MKTYYNKKIFGSDRIGIVGYHDNAFVIAKPAEPHAHWLQTRLHNLYSKVGGSGTNITDGLRKGIQMLQKTPPGILRRLWLLTDGYANRETGQIMSMVQEAFKNRININTIGFGDPGGYDENLLRRIAENTHNGKFIPVNGLRELTDILIRSAGKNKRIKKGNHRAETTILTLDFSPSMTWMMEGKRRIDIVEEAVFRLLAYKQQCFA
jgi:Mg-chelatase subunit ChlD